MKNTPFKFRREIPREVQIRQLQNAIQGELTELQRYTLQEYYFSQRTLQDIADARGVQKSTVWRTLKRAEDKLKRIMAY